MEEVEWIIVGGIAWILVSLGLAIAWAGFRWRDRAAEEAAAAEEELRLQAAARSLELEEELGGALEVVGSADGELGLLCVCSEEFCYCGNLVQVPASVANPRVPGLTIGGWPCEECGRGHHVWTPGGARA